MPIATGLLGSAILSVVRCTLCATSLIIHSFRVFL